jgi:hypothetical protein
MTKKNSVIAINIKIKNQLHSLACIYRPPNYTTRDFNQFWEILEQTLSICNSNNSIILGDFNIDLLQTNHVTTKYLETMNQHSFQICDKTTPTRLYSNTCLDHIGINNYNQQINIQYLPHDRLDHQIIFAEFLTTQMERPTTNSIYLNITNFIKLQDLVHTHPFSNFGRSLNEYYDNFISYLQSNVELATTRKEIKNNITYTKAWIDEETKDAINIKNFWYTKLRHDQSNIFIRNEYIFWRNKVTNIKKIKKKNYIGGKIQKAGTNLRKLWQISTDIIYDYNKNPTNKPGILSSLNMDDKKVKLNDFNDFFISVGETLARNISTNYTISQETLNTFSIQEATLHEISINIAKLKNSSSTG